MTLDQQTKGILPSPVLALGMEEGKLEAGSLFGQYTMGKLKSGDVQRCAQHQPARWALRWPCRRLGSWKRSGTLASRRRRRP